MHRDSVSFFTAHLNSPRLARIRVIVTESIREDMMSCFFCCAEPTQNETRNDYSHHRGHTFVYFVSLRSRIAFKGRIAKDQGEQKIE
jgi:hypothetical protein